jgi:hypothetical protein
MDQWFQYLDLIAQVDIYMLWLKYRPFHETAMISFFCDMEQKETLSYLNKGRMNGCQGTEIASNTLNSCLESFKRQ